MDSAHPHAVLSKLNEQRSQGLFCDVTIVVEDVKFRAHKNILAACSGYFRNALTTPEIWSSGQVLELMDLKSEVFASILNFIYCSKVSSPGAEDTGGIVAAGKRLGIPFLEKLGEQERLDSGISPNLPEGVKATDGSTAPASKKTKKEVSKHEEVDGARGPRITNAFSITEVCPGSNPFTPLVQVTGRRQSAEVGQLPTSTSCLSGNNETTHTLSEHSYAVNQTTEEKDNSQWDDQKVCKPTTLQPKQLIYRNAGPLKKRHRLRGILGRNILPAPSESHADKPNTVAPPLAEVGGVSPAVAVTPPPLFSEAETDRQGDAGLPVSADPVQMELSPPTLSPHPEESISIFGCEHCPEIFTNKALLTIHSEVHKKRFVSHLFCKFCHRKFIHLKRLRNHEQVCPKAARGPSVLGEATPEEDIHSGGESELDDTDTKPPSVDPPVSHRPKPLLINQSERPHGERIPHMGGSQRRYNCSVCKRVYVTLSSLKRHENVHSWQRAYPCHYCNKVFALAEYRTKHEIWHTGERRYQCIFCLETFMTYYILKNHQKSFHGIDPTLAVKKKSANGGLKASVYPIKLYRLLPMKFRKRQYKTYSHTYADGGERGEGPLENSPLIPPFEGNGVLSHPDNVSLPLTFMATTKMVSPVTPCISVEKPCESDIGDKPDIAPEGRDQRGLRRDGGHRGSAFTVGDATFTLHPDAERPSVGEKDDPLSLTNPHHVTPNVTFFNSLNTVKKLGELSASAKRVEDMTKELLQSSAENLGLEKTGGTKTETYIAKPACPGPSADGGTMPLCQITVKIGNEAIIRRRIKGSKLFPRKKRRIREVRDTESPPLLSRDAPESPRLRLRTDITAAKDPYDDPNDCDTADKLWRPYYSYKAKKKRKKLRFKHRQALFHLYPDAGAVSDSEAKLDPRRLEESADVKRLGRTGSPRTTYSCDICHSSFITETGLRAHVIGSHPCFCRTCGEQGPPGEAPAGGDYICNSCMESGSCFDNSNRSSNPEKRYRCSFCPQRFLYLATKRSHEKKHQAAEDGYKYNNFRSCSKYLSQISEDNKDSFKTEELDNHDSSDMKPESVKGEYFPLEKPKVEDTTDFVSLNPYQDISYSHIKRPLSPPTDSLFSLHPLKVKHKMPKKRISAEHSMHLSSSLTSDRDVDGSQAALMGSRSNVLHDPKIFRRSDSDSKGDLASLHRSERRLCKEEPFF